MVKYRCQYRLSDKVVTGAAFGAASGAFNDASHGTTIEFTGGVLPKPFEKTYDPVAQTLSGNPDFGTYLELSTPALDWDKDGVADVLADGLDTAQIDIQKKNAAGDDLTGAEHDDIVFLSVSAGSISESLISLVNGATSILLGTSVDVGCRVTVSAQSKKPGVALGKLDFKFVEEG